MPELWLLQTHRPQLETGLRRLASASGRRGCRGTLGENPVCCIATRWRWRWRWRGLSGSLHAHTFCRDYSFQMYSCRWAFRGAVSSAMRGGGKGGRGNLCEEGWGEATAAAAAGCTQHSPHSRPASLVTDRWGMLTSGGLNIRDTDVQHLYGTHQLCIHVEPKIIINWDILASTLLEFKEACAVHRMRGFDPHAWDLQLVLYQCRCCSLFSRFLGWLMCGSRQLKHKLVSLHAQV